MSPPQTCHARLEDKLILNPKYTQFSFELIKPHSLEFTAGQYLSLKINEQGERRSYSICNPPDIDHQIDLLLDITPAGQGTQFLQQLEFGDEIEFLAPIGRLVIPDDLPVENLALVATGSGIAPFKAIIADQLRNKQDHRPLTLYWGMRYADDLFWLAEMRELADSFDNFYFHPVLSRAAEAWTLCRGRVTDCLSVHQLPAKTAYFLCGGQRMIDDVSSLLTKKGVAQELIVTEKFY